MSASIAPDANVDEFEDTFRRHAASFFSWRKGREKGREQTVECKIGLSWRSSVRLLTSEIGLSSAVVDFFHLGKLSVAAAAINPPLSLNFRPLGRVALQKAFLKPSTTYQNELYSRFCKLFSESSTGIPALLPCSLLPRQARGTFRNFFTKPHCTVHFGT